MSSKCYSKKWVTVLLHTAAWILLFSLPYLLRPSLNDSSPGKQNPGSALMHLRYALNNLIYIGFFYLNAGLLIPQFIYKRNYKQYTEIILGGCIGILFITLLTLFQVLGPPNL